MDLDDLLFSYFRTRDLSEVPSAALSADTEQMQVDLGMARIQGSVSHSRAYPICWAPHPISTWSSKMKLIGRPLAISWTCQSPNPEACASVGMTKHIMPAYRVKAR